MRVSSLKLAARKAQSIASLISQAWAVCSTYHNKGVCDLRVYRPFLGARKDRATKQFKGKTKISKNSNWKKGHKQNKSKKEGRPKNSHQSENKMQKNKGVESRKSSKSWFDSTKHTLTRKTIKQTNLNSKGITCFWWVFRAPNGCCLTLS